MKLLFTLLSVLILSKVIGQTDTTVTLDQLQVPSSPAFNMLGISPNSIERPKNPTDFAFSLGNATSGFTTIPKDYAIEFAPFWLFGKKQITFKDFISNSPKHNILQTATISAATTTAKSQIDSLEFRKMAIALKFSIFRGEMRDEFKRWNDSVSLYLRKSAEILGQIRATYSTKLNNELQLLKKRIDESNTEEERKKRTDSLNILKAQLPGRIEEFEPVSQKMAEDSIKGYKEALAQLKGLASRTDFKRYGFKMDFALGSAMDYPDTSFQKCYVSKFSTWLTMGWENPGINILFVSRFSENINRRFKNDSSKIVNDITIGEFDFGFRIYKDFTEKLTLSAEYLRRLPVFSKNTFTKNDISHPANTSRYVVSINYKVGKNQNLSFVYGKDFDQTYIKQGNLIAALNLMLGFGSSRPLGGTSK